MGRGKNIELSRHNVYSVPEDISIQILVRLPVKSLLRFRSICKSWYSLITNPTFIDLHLKHHTNNTNLLLLLMYENKLGKNFRYSIRYDDDDEFCCEYFEAKLPLHLQNLWIYGTCNGLVCLSNRIFVASSNIFIWNPALRKLKTLPKPKKIKDLPLCAYDMYMAFGFHSQVNDYKVVRIVFFEEGMDNPYDKTSSFLVEVYSLSRDSWRRIDVLEPSSSIDGGCRPVFVNGAAYWTTKDRKVVLRFEMGSEVLEEVMLPEQRFGSILGLGELLYVFNFDYSTNKYHVWTMESSKMGCWTKRFTVRLDHLTGSLLGLRRNGELLIIYRNDKLLSYDLDIQKSNDLGINTSVYDSSAHSYVESLLPVNGRGDSFSTW